MPAFDTKKILLAEDDEDDFLLFQEALKEYKEPIILNWVKDGEALMDVLTGDVAELPHMLFLDINMPRKNGFECLAEIRQHEDLKSLPVIIYSTSNDTALIKRMHNAGANLYLSKPNNFGNLQANIKKAIVKDWEIQAPYSSLQEFVLK